MYKQWVCQFAKGLSEAPNSLKNCRFLANPDQSGVAFFSPAGPNGRFCDHFVTWTGAGIGARFFDDEDQLIDTGKTQHGGLVIFERDACTFKIAYERMLPEEKCSRVSARVIFADDEDSRWPR